MSRRVLVFPGGMPKSIEYANQLRSQTVEVVGASSLRFDNAKAHYDSWRFLPFITEPNFSDELAKVILEFEISEIYTPNLVVWNFLSSELSKIVPGVELANRSPVDDALEGYRKSLSKARSTLRSSLQIASSAVHHPAMSDITMASLYRYADLIPGMCDDDKIHAMLEIFRYSVKGDVVEIGSWWGKSAYVLAMLARHFRVGALLCIDPWDDALLVQDEKVVDSGSAAISASEALDVFKIGMIPFSDGQINFVRLPSVVAAAQFQPELVVTSDAFGSTNYEGNISILHIDGNHAFEAVFADLRAWSPYVVGGGWIILDDYIWPYGDGPKLVGDMLLQHHQAAIEVCFVMGTALFVQLKNPIAFQV